MKKILIFILALTMLVACMPSVSAEVKEKNLETVIDRQKDVVFWVSWEGEQPVVVFIAPDGTEYDPAAKKDGTTTIGNGTNLYYIIEQAQAGQWKVRYDKEVEISVHDYQAGMTIESLKLGKLEDDNLPYSFLVSGDDGRTFSYTLSAVIDHSGEEKVLESGNWEIGEKREGSLRLSSLSTFDKYMIKLYVFYHESGTDFFDVVFSDPFAYTNPNVNDSMADFEMVIYPDEYLIDVSWSQAGWDVDEVLVAIFEDDGAEPTFFEQYKKSEGKVQLGYDPRTKQVRVEVTPQYGGVSGKTLKKTIAPADFGLDIPAGEGFNSKLFPIGYAGFTKQAATVTVGEKKTDLVFDGDGNIHVSLEEGWNNFAIWYTDAAAITWKVARSIFVDCAPPVLNMSRHYDGMVVQDTRIVFSGTVVECAKLTINGTEVTVQEGAFSHEVSLSSGENVITVIAADELGNQTQYVAAVTCGYSGSEQNAADANQDKPGGLLESLTQYGSYWVLLIACLPCALLVAYALVFWKKGGNKHEDGEE